MTAQPLCLRTTCTLLLRRPGLTQPVIPVVSGLAPPRQKELAHSLLKPEHLAHFFCFEAKEKPFTKALFMEDCVSSMKPVTWWSCVSKHTVEPGLCELAICPLNLPASSASVERIFSNFGAVQTKLRNRLGVEKAGKLVACYRTLRGSEEPDW